ncbi:MAG: LLM class flavin-dependent oxidoreductase, partial [Myxococcales bacterium]|nr:LLM class flavin-dependent oxidoreductase [Myxococcales bacterium]
MPALGSTPVPFSVLDLAPVSAGVSIGDSLHRSISLARHVEALGFTRFWLAEHHAMPTIASAAPDLLAGQVAAATTTIRVGSGGIMLPNHAPLMVAE